jgi:hypothetical protein
LQADVDYERTLIRPSVYDTWILDSFGESRASARECAGTRMELINGHFNLAYLHERSV